MSFQIIKILIVGIFYDTEFAIYLLIGVEVIFILMLLIAKPYQMQE